MLAVPDLTIHRTKLADWLEFSCVSSPSGSVGFSTLISAAALSEEEQAEDISEEDLWEDQIVLSAQSEINRRRKNIGEDYPFRIDDQGVSMHFVQPLSDIGSIYLFCLYVSHAYDLTILSKALAPRVTHNSRNMFQACSTLAAGGYVSGPAISFGSPRPDDSAFLAALHRTYALFGDGVPLDKPRVAASPDIKDDGIDVIAWRPAIDGLPRTLYLLGQVASGKNWRGKSVVADSKHFHSYWFKRPPASQHEDAMFMPFNLEPPDPVDGANYDEVLKDHMASLSYRYGTVFYRDRIAKHAAEGLRLVSQGQDLIEGGKEIASLRKWVENYSKRLRMA